MQVVSADARRLLVAHQHAVNDDDSAGLRVRVCGGGSEGGRGGAAVHERGGVLHRGGGGNDDDDAGSAARPDDALGHARRAVRRGRGPARRHGHQLLPQSPGAARQQARGRKYRPLFRIHNQCLNKNSLNLFDP